jgi:hypothetical protein
MSSKSGEDKIDQAVAEIRLYSKESNKRDRFEFLEEVLKKFDLDSGNLPVDFESLYLFALIEFGSVKSSQPLELLQRKSVQQMIQVAYDKGEVAGLIERVERLPEWLKLIEEGKMDREKTSRLLIVFCTIFTELIKIANAKSELLYVHQKIEEVVNDVDRLAELPQLWDHFAKTAKESPSLRFGVAPKPLRVFISSKMNELRDVRELVRNELAERGLDSWIFEEDSGARPQSVTETSLIEVENADVYVGLFWKEFGEITAKEFRHARAMDKPCFIYIREKQVQRDSKLEDFLNIEIREPHCGLTYDYFESALQLSKQVADDIMKWLVRQHREITAEIQQAKISQSEASALRDAINRLQAASRQRLPQGTATDFLACQVKAWFETLGYRFEPHDERNDDYFEWMINVPARRGYDRILVRGVRGEAQLSDIDLLKRAVESSKADEGWIIAARRISQAAREEAKKENNRFFCYTFDDLLDETADFTGYLEWLDSEVKKRGIDKGYISQSCYKEEFDLTTKKKIGISRYNKENGWVEGYIDRWLDDPSKEHISILGEFGTGKTWFALRYAWILAQRYLDAKRRGVERPRLPLVVPLRDYAKAVSVESLFSEFFFRKHEISLPGYSAFEQLNRMGKLLLIFDGFDEMAAKVDRQKMINNFWDLARVVVPGSKAILTCRTEHFPEAREGRALLSAELQASISKLTGEPPQFEVLQLDKFDDDQVRRVFSLRASPEVVDSVMLNSQLLDLARRPIMIDFILEAMPDIVAGKPVDISRVYLYAVKRKIERDIKAERTFTSMADKFFFLCELSWEMLSKNTMSLNYRQFPERLRHLFGHATQLEKDLDYWQYDMMAQTMLIRNDEGDYTPAHRSLLEFFVAYKFAAEMGILASDFVDPIHVQSNMDLRQSACDYTWSQYFRRELDASNVVKKISPLRNFTCESSHNLEKSFGFAPLTEAILSFLVNMLEVDQEKVEQQLSSLVHSTREKNKPREDTGFIGGNSATLLIRLNSSALRQKDLNFTNLDFADFEGADLSNATMRCTSLKSARFKGTTLKNVDLREADLSNAQFFTTGGFLSISYSPKGNMLAVGSEDSNLYVMTFSPWRELELHGHTGPIMDIAWEPHEQLIATASLDGSVRFWEVSSDFKNRESFSLESGAISLCFSPVSHQIVVGVRNSSALVYDYDTKTVNVKQSFSGLVYGIRYDPFGKIIANRANRGTVILWNPLDGKTISFIDGTAYDDAFKYVDFCRDGKLLALTTGYKRIRIVHLDDPIKKEYIKCFGTNVTNIKFSPDGNQIAACCADNTIRVFDVKTNTQIMSFVGHTGELSSLSYHPSGRYLATCSKDTSIRIWDSFPFVTSYEAAILDKTKDACVPQIYWENERNWPEWWQSCRIDVPKGLVPNPKFGCCIRIINRKFDCSGLLLDGAKGLDKDAPDGEGTVRSWLLRQGRKDTLSGSLNRRKKVPFETEESIEDIEDILQEPCTEEEVDQRVKTEAEKERRFFRLRARKSKK